MTPRRSWVLLLGLAACKSSTPARRPAPTRDVPRAAATAPAIAVAASDAAAAPIHADVMAPPPSNGIVPGVRPIPQDAGSAPPETHGTVGVHSSGAPAFQLNVDVALSPASINQGINAWSSIAPAHGMLLVYPNAGPHLFTTQYASIAVDVIYLSADHHVTGLVKNFPAHSGGSQPVEWTSKSVLVVAPGFIDAHHLASGDALDVHYDAPAAAVVPGPPPAP